MTTDDALKRLQSGLDRDERIAQAAIDPKRPGTHWHWVTNETDTPVEPGGEEEALEHEAISLRTVEEFPTDSGVGDLPAFAVYLEDGQPGALRHIANFDPAHAIGIVEAIRKVIAPYLAAVEAVEATMSAHQYAVSRYTLAAIRLDHGSGEEMEERRKQEYRMREELLSAELQLATDEATRDAHASVIAALAAVYTDPTEELSNGD